MIETFQTCPKCKDAELFFEIEHHSADDGRWVTAGLIENERACDCGFTDEEMALIETKEANEYTESLYSYEP